MLRDFSIWIAYLLFLYLLSYIVPGSSPLFGGPVVEVDGCSNPELAHLEAETSSEDSSSTTAALTNLALGLFGGLYVGFGNMLVENGAYQFFEFCGRRKLLRRLAPSIPVTQHAYYLQSFVCVSIPYVLVFYGVALHRDAFIARAVWDFNPLKLYAFLWCVMTVHDFWFFLTHTLMHTFRGLYHRLHALHHASRGDLTVFGTVLGEVPEIMLIFGVFYAGLFTFLYNQPSWNPAAFLALVVAVNATNCIGHCGYDVPDWLGGVMSVGYLLTPGHATSKSHYIHHLNVTVNRALYLKWHDYIWGTYREGHPLIPEDDVAVPRCPTGMVVMPVEEDEDTPEKEAKLMARVASFGAHKEAMVRQLSEDQRVRHMQRSLSRQASGTGSVGQLVSSASGLVRQASGMYRQASELIRQTSSTIGQTLSVASGPVRRRTASATSLRPEATVPLRRASVSDADALSACRRASLAAAAGAATVPVPRRASISVVDPAVWGRRLSGNLGLLPGGSRRASTDSGLDLAVPGSPGIW